MSRKESEAKVREDKLRNELREEQAKAADLRQKLQESQRQSSAQPNVNVPQVQCTLENNSKSSGGQH